MMAYTLLKRCAAHLILEFLILHALSMQAWIEKGLNKGGFLVCKFAFVVGRLHFSWSVHAKSGSHQRLPGQPAIPTNDGDDADDADD